MPFTSLHVTATTYRTLFILISIELAFGLLDYGLSGHSLSVF